MPPLNQPIRELFYMSTYAVFIARERARKNDDVSPCNSMMNETPRSPGPRSRPTLPNILRAQNSMNSVITSVEDESRPRFISSFMER